MTEFPPGLSEFTCELEVGEPGEFASQVHIFVDDGGLREIILAVHGVAQAAQK